MRAIQISFLHMLKFMKKDMMLLAAGLSPLLMGAAIRLGIPAIDKALRSFTGLSQILGPYYSLFDIFYSAITPSMFCFVAAMVMLEERDDHIDRYLFVTDLGKRGYYISRIVIPALVAFVISAVLLPIFRLAVSSFAMILFLSFSGTLQGIIIALLVVNISSNKLEGMALTKCASLMMLGAMGPYFIERPSSHILFFMPSYWTGLVITEGRAIYVLPTVLVSVIWIVILSCGKFRRYT
ncbi:MAG: ABC transporter permease [Butyrivibrio sp.]|nr:ABC transporter permease [Butyrivibrio sp.]